VWIPRSASLQHIGEAVVSGKRANLFVRIKRCRTKLLVKDDLSYKRSYRVVAIAIELLELKCSTDSALTQ
jgi:hypothetical protein